MDYLILVAGLVLIIFGANYLIEGASHIAKRFGISDFIIGLTIVGIGTSTPEMVVSFLSSFQGKGDIAVGNVIGSNIFNSLMILGITALIFPIAFTSNNIRKDIPFGVLAATVLLICGSDIFLDGALSNTISKSDGLILLCFFVVFMAYTIFSASSSKVEIEQEAQSEVGDIAIKKGIKSYLIFHIVLIIGGLGALIWGGELFVTSASSIAQKLGISEAFIAITLMAGGTSLPELASCIVAAYKKRGDMALGNVIGSNVSNIFLILGGSALINPLSMGNLNIIDLGLLLISSILIFLAAFTFGKKRLDRIEGAIFILIYIVYIYYLSINL